MPSGSLSDPSFTPRKEFIRDERITNSFALLAISSSSCIRLYSFPVTLVASLRRLFEQCNLIAAFREDLAQSFCEFTIDGKPWASPKSINSEKLLVDILAIIYQHGYTFLSTIDYGRENDDRLAMAFSTPSTLPASPRSGTPLPVSPVPAGSGSSLSQPAAPKRVPFALSFPSATMLRVINPPLHSTPAILQAVRGSWPRGVVSEKKIGEASYEFKLKGYKWFQEDTFATDSLRHILSLLSSLDAHAFSLLASLSLSNRSRVKDLWVFTGPGPASTEIIDPYFPDSPVSSANNSRSNIELRRAAQTGSELPRYTQLPVEKGYGSGSQHRRLATAPGGNFSQPQPHLHQSPSPPSATTHGRAATENDVRYNVPATPFPNPVGGSQLLPPSPLSPLPPPHQSSHTYTQTQGVLRKPAPRAQVPVSVASEDHVQDQPPGGGQEYRITLPSSVGSVENMTGVGARGGRTPDVFYATAPNGAIQEERQDYIGGGGSPPVTPTLTRGAARSRSISPPKRGGSPLNPVSARSKTPPLFTSHSPSPASSTSHHAAASRSHSTTPPAAGSSAGPLLAAGVFASDAVRDSAFSSNTVGTVVSHEIPIKWTGDLKPEPILHEGDEGDESHKIEHSDSSVKPQRMSTGPVIPGAWAMTPEEEKPEHAHRSKDDDHVSQEESQSEGGEENVPRRPLHAVEARVASPELIHPAEETRKSEAGLVGMISTPHGIHEEQNQPPGEPQRQMSGWVLVNVEGKTSPGGRGSPAVDDMVSRSPHSSSGYGSRKPNGERERSMSPSPRSRSTNPSPNPISSMSPAAKAIVIIDAVDAKERAKAKSRSSKVKSMSNGERSSSPHGLRRFWSLSRAGKSDASDSSPSTSTDALNGSGAEKKQGGGRQRSGFREKLRKMGTPEATISEDNRVGID